MDIEPSGCDNTITRYVITHTITNNVKIQFNFRIWDESQSSTKRNLEETDNDNQVNILNFFLYMKDIDLKSLMSP